MQRCSRCERYSEQCSFSRGGKTYKTCLLCCEEHRRYYKSTVEYRTQHQKEYRSKHKKETAEYMVKYRARSEVRAKIIQRRKARGYYKERYANDPAFKCRSLISKDIRLALKKQGKSKSRRSCLGFLQYTVEELKAHIEKQFDIWMSWNNHGNYNPQTWNDDDSSTWRWQLDHIIPQSKLLYCSMEDENFKKCWALENLRPLSAKENIKKGNK